MRNLAALLILISSVADPSSGKSCKCAHAASGETTRWGGNETVVLKPDGTYEFIWGKVLDLFDKPMDDVLVEVFDKPNYLLCEWKEGNPKKCTSDPPDDQRRLAACVTRKDGKFCFDNIPAGKYELRASKASDWNVTRAVIVVNPGLRWNKRGGIAVEMTLGT